MKAVTTPAPEWGPADHKAARNYQKTEASIQMVQVSTDLYVAKD